MSNPALQFPTQRGEGRHDTSWAAECRVGGRVILGRVRDVTSTGAFFQPEMELVTGTFYGPGATPGLAAGEAVALRLKHRATPDLAVSARVCWTGSSEAHGVAGIGLAFDHEPAFLADPRAA
jgi:hypothetical protein